MERKKRDATGAYEPEVALSREPTFICTIIDTLDTLADNGQVICFVAA